MRFIFSYAGRTPYEPTPMKAKIEKRVREWRDRIIHERLDPWRFLGVRRGIVVHVTMHSGKAIHYEGGTFDGAPHNAFWSDGFMPPFLEDAIEGVLLEVAAVCREHSLPPEDYLTEAGGYLRGMVETIYYEMARVEARLTHRQHQRDVSEYVDRMLRVIDDHTKTARLLAGQNGNTLVQSQPLNIPHLVEKLKALKHANTMGDGMLIKQAADCLGQYARSAENLWAFLEDYKDKYGASANMKNVIDAVKGARISWQGPGFYPALWNMLAAEEIVTELERWREQASVSALAPVQDESLARHSPDYRSVSWYGQAHSFTPNQAAAVKILWEAAEQDAPDVSQAHILTEIESDAQRLRDVFEKGKHAAWRTMIVTGKTRGTFRLAFHAKS